MTSIIKSRTTVNLPGSWHADERIAALESRRDRVRRAMGSPSEELVAARVEQATALAALEDAALADVMGDARAMPDARARLELANEAVARATVFHADLERELRATELALAQVSDQRKAAARDAIQAAYAVAVAEFHAALVKASQALEQAYILVDHAEREFPASEVSAAGSHHPSAAGLYALAPWHGQLALAGQRQHSAAVGEGNRSQLEYAAIEWAEQGWLP